METARDPHKAEQREKQLPARAVEQMIREESME